MTTPQRIVLAIVVLVIASLGLHFLVRRTTNLSDVVQTVPPALFQPEKKD